MLNFQFPFFYGFIGTQVPGVYIKLGSLGGGKESFAFEYLPEDL